MSRTHRLKRLYKVGLSPRVESSKDEDFGEEDASKQRRIANITSNEDIYLVNVYKNKDIFGVNDSNGDEVIVEDLEGLFDVADDLRGEEVFVSKEVPLKEVSAIDEVNAVSTTTTTTATIDDITLAKALMEIKSEKPKTTAASSRPKAKGIVIHDQLKLDEELVLKLHAEEEEEEEEEEERIAKEKAFQIKEANIAWDDVQAKIDADYEVAQKLQPEEQDELTDAEKAKLFMELLKKRRKFFAAKRAKEKRNKLPTRAQQRTIMCSSKRAGDELEQERSKKQKVEDDKEYEELKQCLEIIPDDGDDVTIDATHLPSNSPTIVDYKIYKEGKKNYFQIFRADGNSQMYLTFSKMLTNFDREDLKVLWRLVKDRFEKLSIKKLKILKKNIKFRRGLLGIKSLQELTAAKVRVNATKLKLALLSNLSEKYAK
nr:hypothetical protein [Tanacetum cinerariifolium]